MSFNLTPTITISTETDLDAALTSLAAEGVDDGWLSMLRRTAEPHLQCEHGLVAACYDASCRPPTSGGTGGSSPKGGGTGASAPRKKKADEAAEAPSGSRFFMSEFGSKVREMIKNEPALARLSRSVIDKEMADDNAREQERADRVWNERWSNGDTIDGKITVSRRYGSVRDDPAKGEITRAEYEEYMVATGGAALKRILAGNAQTDAERYIGELIQRRVNETDKRYWDIAVVTPNGVTITLKGDRRKTGARASDYGGVTPEVEEAVKRVGAVVRGEVDRRMSESFNKDEVVRVHQNAMDDILKYVQTIDPNYVMKDITIQQYSGEDKPYLHIWKPALTEVSREQRGPIYDILKSYGVKSSVLDYHVRNTQNAAHRQILTDVMAEIRPMGGALTEMPRHRKPKSGRSSNEQLTDAIAQYPTDWLDASNANERRMDFRQTKGRAHYQHAAKDGRSELTLDGSHGTAVHEIAHRMEKVVPGVRALESQIFGRRAGGDTIEKMGKGYGRDEETAPDQFFDRYVGKIYPDAYEVLSMGWEHLQTASGWGKVDADHTDWTLGVLSTAYRSD